MIYTVRASAVTSSESKVAVALAKAGAPFSLRSRASKMGCSGGRLALSRERRAWVARAALAALLLAASLGTPSFAQQATPESAPTSQAAASATEAQAVPAPAAQPAAQAPATYQPPAAPGAVSLLQTLFALCFVLALLAALAWLAKRYGPRAMGGNANLRVVGSLSLGGRERVLVVEVADQWIVVGAAPGRVNLLTTMPRQEGVMPAPGAAVGVPAGFGDWLKQTLDKRNAK